MSEQPLTLPVGTRVAGTGIAGVVVDHAKGGKWAKVFDSSAYALIQTRRGKLVWVPWCSLRVWPIERDA